ncbi:MAG: ABC transporter substrate-binding protein [candidate division NC10 bacterium]|nr:ABC transporter substrate-binding protein [candidate division NC10 bacterium]
MQMWRQALVIGILILGLIVPHQAMGLEKVQIAVGGAPGALIYLPFDIGKALGFFAEEGIEPEIQSLKGGAQAASALIGGSVDFSGNALDHVIKAKLQGKDLKMVVSFTHLPGVTLVVNEKYRGIIKSPKDLKGRPVGISSPGSATHMLLSYILVKNGLTPQEVTVVGVGTNTLPPALEHDHIHAGLAIDPYVTSLLKTGKAFSLIDLSLEEDTRAFFGGLYQFTGLLVRAELIQKRPELIQKMVNVMVKANRWITTHTPQEIAAVLPSEAVGDQQTYIESLEHSKAIFSKDGLVTKEGVSSVLRAFEAFGGIPRGTKLAPESLYDMRFVKKTLGKR